MQDFDKLWDYRQPAETERKFREILNGSDYERASEFHLQLLTQIARTFSLRRMFDEAHNMLNEVSAMMTGTPAVSGIRYYLELGRTYNSSGNKPAAVEAFTKALNIAAELHEDAYTIDALHMLAIISDPETAISLNEQAIQLAEASQDVRANNWLGSLYNNLGWAYFDKQQFERALIIFLRALQWREGKESPTEIFIAKWCVARTLRALNRLDEAIKIQLALLEQMVETGQEDGYVYEELGELYLLKNESIHKMYFGFAFRELSKDPWMGSNEIERLQRMETLSKD